MADEPYRVKLSLFVYSHVINSLDEAAKPLRERARKERRSGKPPGRTTVASNLFEAAWPLFEACGFDPERVEEEVAGLTAPRKKGNQGR